MKNERLTTFHKKVKERTKIMLFMFLLIQGYFLWCITFFGGTILQFSQKFCTKYKILHALILSKTFFLRSYLYFLETLKPQKEEMAYNIG